MVRFPGQCWPQKREAVALPDSSRTKLPSSGKRRLRARAHALKVVIIVGAAGVTVNVIAAVDQALQDHGLIKIRINAADRKERRGVMDQICRDTGAELIQTVGHVAVLYREPKDENLRQPFLPILN